MSKELYKLIFNINSKNEIKILDDDFMIKAKNKGKLIIKNKKKTLESKTPVKYIKDSRLKIKIILCENIYDKSYMFKNCKDLVELSYEIEKEKKEQDEIEKMEDKNNEIIINNYLYEEKDNLIDNMSNANTDVNSLFNNTNSDQKENIENSISIIPSLNINSLNITVKNVKSQLRKFESKVIQKKTLGILKVCFISVSP